MALGLFLTPFVVIVFLVTFQPQFANWIPFLCISQCQHQTDVSYNLYINKTMQWTVCNTFAQNILFFLCLFLVRNVSM